MWVDIVNMCSQLGYCLRGRKGSRVRKGWCKKENARAFRLYDVWLCFLLHARPFTKRINLDVLNILLIYFNYTLVAFKKRQ